MPPAFIYSVIAVLVVGFVGYIVWRRFRIHAGTDAPPQLIVVPAPEPPTIRSPLRDLSFDDVLSVAPMYNGLRVAAEEQITVQFTQIFGDGVVASANAVKFIQATGEYVVEFSEKGKQLLQSGKAILMKGQGTGRMIPNLVGLDGKIIEQSREVGKFKSLTGKLASVSSMIVGAAHVISGADVAKKLDEVRRDVKFLKEARKNDHLAKLEAIFDTSKQLLSQPLTENGTNQIRGFVHDLRELRATWRRDLETKLEEITNPNDAGRLKRFFSRQRSRDRKVADSISALIGDISLIESSLVLQIALATSIADAEALVYEVLPGELRLLRKTLGLFREKAGYISGKLPDVHVEPVLATMNQMVERMSAFVPNDKLDET